MENETVKLPERLERTAIIVVRTTTEYSECYAVIDKNIVWHGGMNLLGNSYGGDNLIRIENRQAAEELLEITNKNDKIKTAL